MLRSNHFSQDEPVSTYTMKAQLCWKAVSTSNAPQHSSGISTWEQPLQLPFKDMAGGKGSGWGGTKTAPAARARWLQPFPMEMGAGFGLFLQGWF